MFKRFVQLFRTDHSAASPARKVRLAVEPLEDRAVPATWTAATVAELIGVIAAANQTPEADTIELAAGKTFTLTAVNNTANGATGLPAIAAGERLTIVGHGDIIERSAVVGTPAFRLFDVAPGASLALTNLTLQNGMSDADWFNDHWVSGRGGAVHNQGVLNLDTVTIRNNTADGYRFAREALGSAVMAGLGGGVYTTGTLSMTACVVQNNSAVGGDGYAGFVFFGGGYAVPGGVGGAGSGGGLYVAGGTVTIDSTTFTGNVARGGDGGPGYKAKTISSGAGNGGNASGGGVAIAGGTVTFSSSTITANTATGGWGGGKQAASGQGIGGGLSIAPATGVTLDDFTFNHTKQNTASTSDPNISGTYMKI